MTGIDRTKYLSLDEIEQLRRYCRQARPVVWMAVDLALSTGLRVGELAGICIEHIDFDRQILTVTRLKKREPEPESLALGDDLLEHIRAYLDGTRAWVRESVEDYGFGRGRVRILGPMRTSGPLLMGQRGPLTRRGLQQLWDRAVAAAGLPHLSIHGARHTMAVHLLARTKNLRQVQKQLGHAKPATTANMYADVSFEDMRQGVTRLYEREGAR